MDNDDRIVGNLISRREAMRLAAKAGLAIAAGAELPGTRQAWSRQPRVNIVVSPELTEGPFFVDERLNRSDLIAASTRPTVAKGIPLILSLSVLKLKDSGTEPLVGAHIDVWHADAAGVYSDEANPMNHEDTSHQTWLRGYQVVDPHGVATFQTIFPGWYSGRAPHIHFKVRRYSAVDRVTAEFTSQLFFKPADAAVVYASKPYASRGGHDTSNVNDHVYNGFHVDGKPAGELMLLELTKQGRGYRAQFVILVDDTNLKLDHQHRQFGGPPPFGPPA